MLKDYVVYDDVLSNVNEIVEFAKSIPYYSSDGRTIDRVKLALDSNKPRGGWKGLRSKSIDSISTDLFENIFNQVLSKMVDTPFTKINFDVESYFHLAPEYIAYNDKWWHTDTGSLYAGVIYLNPNPPPNSGTLLIDSELHTVNFDNTFNRLVTYRSDLLHRPEACFGNSIDNCRLTITFFIRSIQFSYERLFQTSR